MAERAVLGDNSWNLGDNRSCRALVAIPDDSQLLIRYSVRITSLTLLAVLCAACSSDVKDALPNESTPASVPEAAARASEWPVGGEWRFEQPWASPQPLWSSQYDLWQTGIQECMTAGGFQYPPVKYVDTDLVYRLSNPLNSPVWQTYGYSEPPSPEPLSDTSQRPQAYFDLLLAPGGCADRASSYVYAAPDAQRFVTLQSSAIVAVENALLGYEATPDGTARLDAWRACMSERGYDYSQPGEARETFTSDAAVTSDELETRRADFDCDVAVGLTMGRSQWESDQLEKWLADHSTSVLELNKALDDTTKELVDLAAALAQGGPDVLPILSTETGPATASTLPPATGG